jgi:hypothetical protein
MTGFTLVLTLRLQLAKVPVNLADSFGSSVHFCTALHG